LKNSETAVFFRKVSLAISYFDDTLDYLFLSLMKTNSNPKTPGFNNYHKIKHEVRLVVFIILITITLI